MRRLRAQVAPDRVGLRRGPVGPLPCSKADAACAYKPDRSRAVTVLRLKSKESNVRKMKAALVTEPKGAIQVVERDVPQPGAGQVLVKVQACGICHSDALTKEGLWPGLQYPRVPGHEIAGVIEALGPGVEGWQTGARVGVGWYGGHCGRCAACRSGDFVLCEQGQVPGISYDGGYAQYMVAPVDALATKGGPPALPGRQ